MAKTLRRKPWGRDWQRPDRWAKNRPDDSCKPGCGACGKSCKQRRHEKRQMRDEGKRACADA